MTREGCPDLDPMWPGTDSRPRGPALCVLYPRCPCGNTDKRQAAKDGKRAITLATAYRPEVP